MPAQWMTPPNGAPVFCVHVTIRSSAIEISSFLVMSVLTASSRGDSVTLVMSLSRMDTKALERKSSLTAARPRPDALRTDQEKMDRRRSAHQN